MTNLEARYFLRYLRKETRLSSSSITHWEKSFNIYWESFILSEYWVRPWLDNSRTLFLRHSRLFLAELKIFQNTFLIFRVTPFQPCHVLQLYSFREGSLWRYNLYMAYTMILWLLDPPQPERRMLATGIFKKISCLVLHVTYGRSCVQNSYHPSLQNLIVPDSIYYS